MPPTINTQPENVTVISPDDATLSCVADGVPPPSIQWIRQDIMMEVPPFGVVDGNTTIITIEESMTDRTTTSMITFFGTQPPFAAEYACRASNLLASVEAVGVLTVHGEI